jgi:[CysO sulfur-carrier protein]-S-L-cysteine hydrolase
MGYSPKTTPGMRHNAAESEDSLTEPVRYDANALARLVELCEADPAHEVCGFVLRRESELEVVPVPNAADRYHEADPGAFPRTSRDSYLMDPRAQLKILREVDESGAAIVAVWHSHVEGGAHFSAKDRADAVVDGVQQVPGAEYLVLAVRAGRVTEARRYRYDGERFVEAPLDATATSSRSPAP